MFCEREIARKDERRIEMSIGLARFPFVRYLEGFDFAAQPSIDKKQIREIATGRFIANAEGRCSGRCGSNPGWGSRGRAPHGGWCCVSLHRRYSDRTVEARAAHLS